MSAGADWSGASSYFVDVTVERDRDVVVKQRARLRQDVRERLEAAGDETFPYVLIHDRAAVPAID